MNNILDKALVFATNAHEGQKRKYTGENYINHPIRVMELVATKTNCDIALVTALLHDTVEDTDVTFKDIYDNFGYSIMKNVYYLTDCSHDIGNRKTRKMIEADGWFQVAQKGGHRQFKHASKKGRVTISGKPSDDMAKGTLNNIFKQAQITGD